MQISRSRNVRIELLKLKQIKRKRQKKLEEKEILKIKSGI